MSSQPQIGELQSAVRSAPGVPVIRNVNWGGLWTLYIKEVRRFFKVQLQTVWAPVVSFEDGVPLMTPVPESMDRPPGRPSAE